MQRAAVKCLIDHILKWKQCIGGMNLFVKNVATK